jgi:hypothetical protein
LWYEAHMICTMRLSTGLLLVLLCGPAAAQSPTPPAPRVTLNVALPAPPDHRLSGFGPPGRLAVGADGSLYVATSSFLPSPDGISPARSARIELLAYGRDGAPRFRTMLPVQAGVGPSGFNAESLGVVAYLSGESAVFLSSSNTRVALPQDERTVTTLFRVDTSGKVLRAASVPPAAASAGAFYRTKVYLPTADNGLLVGGGYGPDPFNWWIGKFDAASQRAWQAGPGPAYPEDVYGLSERSDGGVSAIVQEVGQASGLSQWYVARFAADGTPQGRAPFGALGTSFARLPAFWVSAVDVFQTANGPGLVRLDDQGQVLGRAAWPFDQTRRLIADGDGIAAVVCAAAGPLCFVVRAGADGKIRWQSNPGSFSDIARTPDGQIAAISWTADMLNASLVRYADP